MPAPYSPKAIANAIVQRSINAKVPIGHLALQKLVFLAHGYHLAYTDGVPLIDEPLEAWDYGPVCRSLYNEFRDCGRDSIKRLATELDWEEGDFEPVPAPEDDLMVKKIVDFVFKTYSGRPATVLSSMSHKDGWAWDRTRENDKFGLKNVDIPNDWIKEDFKPFIKSKAA